jgi:hypothetical protein
MYQTTKQFLAGLVVIGMLMLPVQTSIAETAARPAIVAPQASAAVMHETTTVLHRCLIVFSLEPAVATN